MKKYHIYVFTQDACPPCHRLKKHVERKLTEAEQAELDFVPMKTATGQRTALAEELGVELTPTLVVVHETVSCDYDELMGYEFCDLEEESVERFVGANNIIEHLDATLDAYTYAHSE
jgi:thioredoxin-related protein